MPRLRARLAAWTAALALPFAPALASAAMPAGSLEFQLGGANSLWMGGDVDTHADADGFCASFGRVFDDVEHCDYELVVDGRGKISGHAVFVAWVDGALVELEGSIRGAQRGSNRTGITRAGFVLRLAGTTSRGGLTLYTRVSHKLVARIDAGGVMTGTWTYKTCFEGAACETSQFPAGPRVWSNGHWTLALDVEPVTLDDGGGFGRRSFTAGALAGVAQVRFGDDTLCEFAVSGRHDPKRDASDLELTPTSAKCRGGSLRLRSFTAHDAGLDVNYLAQLEFRLFGVAGTTVIDTQAPSDYRVLLEHYNDPIDQPLPGSGSSGSSSSGAVVMILMGMPSNFPPSSSGAGASISTSSSAGLVMVALPDRTPPSVGASAEEISVGNREGPGLVEAFEMIYPGTIP